MRLSAVILSILSVLGSACFTAPNSEPVQGGGQSSSTRRGNGGSISSSRAGSSSATSTASAGSASGGTSGAATGSSSGAVTGGGSSTSSGGGSSSEEAFDAGCPQSDGSDAGSTEPFSCPIDSIPPYDGGCPSGEAVRSYLVNIATCEGIFATVSAIDSNGVPVSGDSTLSDPCSGDFSLCTPQNGPFTVQIQAANFPTTYTAEMTSLASGAFAQFVMITSDELDALEAFLPVQIDPNRDTLIVGLPSQSGQCQGPPKAGWTFALSLPDGGAFPDGGYYLSYQETNFIPSASLTSTSELGTGIFFNVDPTIADYVLITATNPNPGSCDPRNVALGFTGRVFVTASALSYDAFMLP